MAASLLGLLKELLDNITDDLGHASILALRSTCKQPHATVSHHNNVRIKEPLNGQRTYTISDLLEIERWPCYDSAEQREDGLKQAVAELDSFACFICLKIRSAGYFSNAMMKARRGKLSPCSTTERRWRFCIPCGVKTGRYQRGTRLRYGGAIGFGGGYRVVCSICGGFKQVTSESEARNKACKTCSDRERGLGDRTSAPALPTCLLRGLPA
ncbi:hypothetical protein BJ546DRAFT_205290 [Cryomyces antarcticus]